MAVCMLLLLLLAASGVVVGEAGSGSGGGMSLIQLVTDVVRFNRKAAPPSYAVALVCWGKGNVALWRALSREGVAASLLHGEDRSRWPMSRVFPSPRPPDLFLVDVGCPKAAPFLRHADEQRLFADPDRWLLIDSQPSPSAFSSQQQTRAKRDLITTADPPAERPTHTPTTNDLLSFEATEEADLGARFESLFGLQHALVDSQVLVARAVGGDPPAFDLLEIYRRGAEQPLTVVPVGAWREGRGISWGAPLALSARRMDLGGIVIKAGMVATTPDSLNHLDDLIDRHVDTIPKINYQLLNPAAEALNASIDYSVFDQWGQVRNGSWTGMVGYLQRGEGEIGASTLFMRADRLHIVEYIALTTPARGAFLFRRPPLSLVTNIFTLPFRPPVWVVASALLTVMASMLYAAVLWETKDNNKGKDKGNAMVNNMVNNKDNIKDNYGQLHARWGEVAMVALGAVCQQGSPRECRGMPGRTVSLMLFVLVMFLYTSYSANIVALLQSTTDSIRTLQDFHDSNLEAGVHDIVYNRHYFKIMTEPLRKRIILKKIAPPGGKERFYTLEEGYARAQKGMFAFFSEQRAGYHVIQKTWTEDEKCGLEEIPFLQVSDPYLCIRRGTPFREVLRVLYRKMAERGVQSRALRRMYTRKPECVGQGSTFLSVGIVECYPAMLVVVYGVSIALAILIAEVIFHRC